MIRIETKHLFSESVSPNIKRLILKRRSGIPLTERELDRLKSFNESVSIKTPTPLHNRINKPPKPVRKPENIDDLDWEDEVDLDEILREMGYEDEVEDPDLEDVIKELELEIDLQEILDEMGYTDDD